MSEFELYSELVEEFQKNGLELSKNSNGYSVVYNEQVENLIAKLLTDFYSLDHCNVLLQNKSGDAYICINNNDREFPDSMLLNQIGDSLDSYASDFDYLSSMDRELASVYELFKTSLNYDGNFGIGFQNVPAKKKYVIKTDIPAMQEALTEAGFEMEENRIIVPEEDKERFYELIEKTKEKLKDKDISEKDATDVSFENNIIEDKDEDSKVDFYEKVVTTAAGLNAIVRLSIVKQDKGPYNRLVTVSYISKETGVLTSTQVFGYEDGHQFDNDVLPSIIDGFQRNVVLSGRQVQVNEVDSTKLYLTSGDGKDDVMINGCNLERIDSFLKDDREYNLVGDEKNNVNFEELYEDNIIEEAEYGETFEGEVADTKDEPTLEGEENSYSQDGPKMVKKLGEMPTGYNNYGLSNSVSLALFLAIDVVAIFVGLFLLMH